MSNRCPHCGLHSLVRDIDPATGKVKGCHCILCARSLKKNGDRYVSVKRETGRGCFVTEGAAQ